MSNPAAILKTSWSQRRILKLRLWGVLLISSSNNTIGSDNTASVNSQYGIYLSFSSSNNTIKKNKAKGNTTCDLFHDGSGNILSQNKADCVNGF
jgi:parallel beta-helix repeat protein